MIFTRVEFLLEYPIPRENADPGIKIFSGFSNPDLNLRDLGIFGILHSGFFRDILEVFASGSPGFRAFRNFILGVFRNFQIPIPIPTLVDPRTVETLHRI